MKKVYSACTTAAVICLVLTFVLSFIEDFSTAAPALAMFFIFLAVGVRGYRHFRGFSFTLGIFAAVTLAMTFPQFFVNWGSFELKTLIVPLLQIIMFGMGTAMSLSDFSGVVKMPKGVLVGLLCQFTIMPLVGYSLAKGMNFPAEIAAGVVLVGSSPSGLASNVMAYIARANLALSVTLTAVATMLAPLMTPLLMKWLAGAFVPVDFWGMMWSITKIVIIPVVAGLIVNRIFRQHVQFLNRIMPMVSMAGIGFIIMIITAAGRDSLLEIGALLVLACLIHNLAGYLLGYWGCRLTGMDEQTCRTVALEVGLQNGGLASGIALTMGKVATVGLAPAVFGPLMNITGSSLAARWREKTGSSEVKTDLVG